METENWGRRIRAFRKLKGYTQISFAEALEISVSVLGEIERGNRKPTNQILDAVSELLEVDKEELIPAEDK